MYFLFKAKAQDITLPWSQFDPQQWGNHCSLYLTATMTSRKLVRRSRKQKVLQKQRSPLRFLSFLRMRPLVILSITLSELIDCVSLVSPQLHELLATASPAPDTWGHQDQDCSPSGCAALVARMGVSCHWRTVITWSSQRTWNSQCLKIIFDSVHCCEQNGWFFGRNDSLSFYGQTAHCKIGCLGGCGPQWTQSLLRADTRPRAYSGLTLNPDLTQGWH